MIYNLFMQNKLLIFDLDGTLVNTVVDLNMAINYGLENNGFPLKSVDQTTKAIGNGISKTIYRSLPDNTSEEVHDQVLKDFRKFYKDHYLDNSKPYPNMLETLRKLKSSGFI